MERLIAFLMNNFVFVIVVLGIIYSMFFRKSPLERPPNRMPDFGGGGFPRPQRPGERRPPGPPAQQPAPDETGFPAPRPAAPPVTRKQPEWMETREPRLRPAQREQPQRMPAGGPAPDRVDREQPQRMDTRLPERKSEQSEPRKPLSIEAAPALSQPAAIVAGEISGLPDSANKDSGTALSREDLTRAIVWAEILGPPRARRPHRR